MQFQVRDMSKNIEISIRYLISRAGILVVWFPHQQHQHYLGIWEHVRSTFRGPYPIFNELETLGLGPSNLGFNKPGDFNISRSLRITVLGVS